MRNAEIFFQRLMRFLSPSKGSLVGVLSRSMPSNMRLHITQRDVAYRCTLISSATPESHPLLCKACLNRRSVNWSGIEMHNRSNPIFTSLIALLRRSLRKPKTCFILDTGSSSHKREVPDDYGAWNSYHRC